MSDDVDDWRARLESNRAEKDRFFAEHPQSPIPPDEREDFDGLDYFDPDPDYRVRASVTVHDDPDPVELETSDGRTVRYLDVVTFSFDLDGETRELHGYRQDGDDEAALFVPFRDETTGEQTYDGGRYMELQTEGDLADGDEVTLDFNLAYAPFCAFSETFACPYPPAENRLETSIPAGERTT